MLFYYLPELVMNERAVELVLREGIKSVCHLRMQALLLLLQGLQGHLPKGLGENQWRRQGAGESWRWAPCCEPWCVGGVGEDDTARARFMSFDIGEHAWMMDTSGICPVCHIWCTNCLHQKLPLRFYSLMIPYQGTRVFHDPPWEVSSRVSRES